MTIQSVTVLADEFPHISTHALAASFDHYNVLRDMGYSHDFALHNVRQVLTTVYGVSDPYDKVTP